MSVVTIVIAHREPMVAEGLAAALERHPGMLVMGSVTSSTEVASLGAGADAVAIDVDLPDAEGAATRLRAAGVHVVLLGSVEAIDGGRFVSTRDRVASLADALDPHRTSSPTRHRCTNLTAREREVLSLVAKGLAAKQVARQMGISHKTVERHKTRIFAKLGVPNAAAAVGLLVSIGREGDAA